jgi:hypothetical protein
VGGQLLHDCTVLYILYIQSPGSENIWNKWDSSDEMWVLVGGPIDVMSNVGMMMKWWMRWVFGQEDTAVRGTVNGWLVRLGGRWVAKLVARLHATAGL